MKLLPKLVIILLFISIAPLAISEYYSIKVSEEEVGRRIEELQLKTASNIANYVNKHIVDIINNLRFGAGYIKFDTMGDDLKRRNLKTLYDQFEQAYVVALLDETGREVVPAVYGAEGEGSRRVTPEQAMQFIKSAPRAEALAKGFAVGEPTPDRGRGDVTVPVAVVFPVNEGRGRWVLAVELSTKKIQEMISKVTVGMHGGAMLIDGRNRIMCHREMERALSAEAMPASLPGMGGEAKAGTGRYSQAGGTQMLAAWANVGTLGWKVVIQEPAEEAFAVVGMMRNQTFFWIGASLLIALFIAFFFAKSISDPVKDLAGRMEKVKAGDLKQVLEVKGKDEISMLGRTFNFMVEGLREREFIKDTFKRYVSEQVAQKILEGKQFHVDGERRKVTILFQDIRGFTSMSEKLQPEEIVSMLNEYFGLMVDIIFKYEGTLDKYIGDAIMAVFGTPINHDDDPLRAVRTAVEMQKAMVVLNKSRQARGLGPIHVGCGINTGEAVAGSMGSRKRMEYTVIGDTVNLASRIEGKTAMGQVLISEETYKTVKDHFKFKKWEPIMVKGKSEPINIYEVIIE